MEDSRTTFKEFLLICLIAGFITIIRIMIAFMNFSDDRGSEIDGRLDQCYKSRTNPMKKDTQQQVK